MSTKIVGSTEINLHLITNQRICFWRVKKGERESEKRSKINNIVAFSEENVNNIKDSFRRLWQRPNELVRLVINVNDLNSPNPTTLTNAKAKCWKPYRIQLIAAVKPSLTTVKWNSSKHSFDHKFYHRPLTKK